MRNVKNSHETLAVLLMYHISSAVSAKHLFIEKLFPSSSYKGKNFLRESANKLIS
jgi:hypothetical protein